MNRRKAIKAIIGGLAYAATGAQAEILRWPDEGLWNPCLPAGLPPELAGNELLNKAWEGIDTRYFRDVHTHLIGTGDSNGGIWINANLQSWWHPVQHVQFEFYLNASCTDKHQGEVDQYFVLRLRQLMEEFPSGAKAMLLALDYHHHADGAVDLAATPFHTPNDYAWRVAQQNPERLEWIGSVHPYRPDAVERLKLVIKQGAKAIKWLPAAMGINPASPRCDEFYALLAKHRIPLLTHAGDEHAVNAAEAQALGNPLLLRRPLEHGVKVIVAHCGTLGDNVDLDKGVDGPRVPNIFLFDRLMKENRYESQLYGDISAITQINRPREELDFIFRQTGWHHRLVYGSDYPLPGVMPVFSLDMFVNRGQLTAKEAEFLSAVREHNPILFDFLLKRLLRVDGIQLPKVVFEAARIFS